MALKNYTTQVKVEKTIMEIEQILAKAGVTHIFKVYNPDTQEIDALAFQKLIQDQMISFKLPMELDKILQVFKNQNKKGNLPKKFVDDKDQARRVGWRIIKDWVDSQMALIEIHMVKLEEVFLPYMYDMKTNTTLFEKMEKTGFNLQLEDKSQ